MADGAATDDSTKTMKEVLEEKRELHGKQSYHYFWAMAGENKTEPKFIKRETIEKRDASIQERKESAKKISKFIWFDDGAKVKIQFEMDGIGELKENIECEFSERAFEVFIRNDDDKAQDLIFSIGGSGVAPLNAEIVPELSKVTVKPNKLSLTLRKKDESKHWYQLKLDKSKLNI